MDKAALVLSPFFSPNVGGVETHLDDLVAFLAEKRAKAYVLTFKPITAKTEIPYERRETRGSVTIYRRWWPGGDLFHRLASQPLLQFLYIFTGVFLYALAFLMRHRDVRVIHAHGLNAVLAARLLAFVFPVDLVASTHAIYGFAPGSLMAKVARWAFAPYRIVHTLSKPSYQELERIGVDPRILTVTYYWVDAERFRAGASPQRRGNRAIFVGRLLPIKGLSIIQGLAARFPEMEFTVIGTGPLEDELRRFAEAHPNFKFLGRKPNDEVPRHLCDADFMIVPSQYEEGLGRVIIEALFCGVPVIGTDRGGIAEAITPEVGRLTDGSLASFEAAVREVQEPGVLDALAANTRRFAQQRFGLANAEKIFASYALGAR